MKEKFNSFIEDGFSYTLFRPKPWKLFIVCFQDMTISKRIRFILSSITGDVIYYMMNEKNVYLGYCLLERKNWRYPFLKKNDYIISPYVINPEYRGMGLGTQLLRNVGNAFTNFATGRLYAMVKIDNTPSIRAFEKVNATQMGYANIDGVFRKYKKCSRDSAEFLIYMI
ncbi:MAG: GNAT family N-acetyltransferase [Lachnospiraceae bacterium]|nr:GNAT family N-acetyltransferase [Lachnospiraceae bacterium]